MNDPFERTKKIRSGELDKEMPPFEELVQWLSRIPKTWLPSLLIRLTDRCERERVFVEGGLKRVVDKAVKDSKLPLGLREEPDSLTTPKPWRILTAWFYRAKKKT